MSFQSVFSRFGDRSRKIAVREAGGRAPFIRAAVELEAAVSPARFAAYAEVAPVLIASAPECADYARSTGASR